MIDLDKGLCEMKYVLIIMLVSVGDGGVDIQEVSFQTKDLCEHAAQTINRTPVLRLGHFRLSSQRAYCFKQGLQSPASHV